MTEAASIPARAAKLLWDARDAAEKVVRFTAGSTESSFTEDELVRSAVERQFEIMGEAISVLRREHPVVSARVPNEARIIGFRNFLIHQYDQIRTDSVWRIVRHDVPSLIMALSGLLSEADPP